MKEKLKAIQTVDTNSEKGNKKASLSCSSISPYHNSLFSSNSNNSTIYTTVNPFSDNLTCTTTITTPSSVDPFARSPPNSPNACSDTTVIISSEYSNTNDPFADDTPISVSTVYVSPNKVRDKLDKSNDTSLPNNPTPVSTYSNENDEESTIYALDPFASPGVNISQVYKSPEKKIMRRKLVV